MDVAEAEQVFDRGATTVEKHVEALLVASAGLGPGAMARAIATDLRCHGWLRDERELADHGVQRLGVLR